MSSMSTRTQLDGFRVLVVDDEEDIRRGLGLLVGQVGAGVREAADGQEALDALEREAADLVLTDLMMPRVSGSELLAAIRERWPSTLVVVLTGFGTVDSAVTCLQGGAAHFLTKPFDNNEVQRLVERLGRHSLAARRQPEDRARLVAEDPGMLAALAVLPRAADSPVPVLVEGASGTGKEVVARELHARSPRRDRPFLPINVAAVPEALLESELFGHERGAFTGADRKRDGIFVQAHGGTVFLDEVAAMPPSFQSKLLRVLQERRVRTLGGSDEVPVDFRLVAASNQDLEERVRAGEFREDLFYRLAVVRIRLPELRERPQDLEPLAEHFLERAATTCLQAGQPLPELADDARRAIRRHSWPGNVRELENAVQRALVVCKGGQIRAHHLGLSEVRPNEPAETDVHDYQTEKQRAIESFQREFVSRALEGADGNVSRAAERCGLTRAALQRIMRQLEIDRRAFRSP